MSLVIKYPEVPGYPGVHDGGAGETAKESA